MVYRANALTLALGVLCVPPARSGAAATHRTCSLSGQSVIAHTDQPLHVFERLLSQDCRVTANTGVEQFANHAISW